jgi:hypothetical protein
MTHDELLGRLHGIGADIQTLVTDTTDLRISGRERLELVERAKHIENLIWRWRRSLDGRVGSR